MLDARPPVRWSQEDRNFIEALAEKGQQGEVSLKELNNLRVRIGGAAKSWLNNFIKKGNGVRVLVTLMWGRLLREPFGPADELIIHELLLSLKAVMNTKHGLTEAMSVAGVVDAITLCVAPHMPSEVCCVALNILAVLSFFSQHG